MNICIQIKCTSTANSTKMTKSLIGSQDRNILSLPEGPMVQRPFRNMRVHLGRQEQLQSKTQLKIRENKNVLVTKYKHSLYFV